MPNWDDYREFQDFDRMEEELLRKEMVLIDRPIILHREKDDGTRCDCGCNNWTGKAFEGERPHIQLLINRWTGVRRLRAYTPPEHLDAFDALAEEAERIYLPLRSFEEQLEPILDRTHKVIAVFGGQRGGKTTVPVQRCVDTWCLMGGPSRPIWWVAPKQDKTQIAVRRLVTTGEGDLAPVFPPELVHSWPKNHLVGDQSIRLFDGSQIALKYGKASNLVGDPAVELIADEVVRIDDESAFETMVGRLTDFRGQLVTSSTPGDEGHWAEEKILRRCKTYIYFRDHPEHDGESKWVTTTLDAWKNPFVPTSEADAAIEGKEDDPQVLREWKGLWVGSGPRVWRHFRESPDPDSAVCHVRSGPFRDVDNDHWKLVNVTPSVARKHWQGSTVTFRYTAGLDINLFPSHLMVAQVAVPKGLDETKWENQILFVLDEVVRNGTSWEVAKFLAEDAHRVNRFPSWEANPYRALPIACDPSGAHRNQHPSHGLHGKSHAWAFNQHGHDCRTANPHYVDGKMVSRAISRFDYVSLLHLLMLEKVVAPDGTVWPRLVVHAERCPVLLNSLKTQQADHRGLPLKKPGKASDKLCGPTEAVAYLAWALWRDVYVRTVSPAKPW